MAISISVLSRGPLGVLLALFKSVLLWLLVPVKRVPVAAYRRPSELTPAETGKRAKAPIRNVYRNASSKNARDGAIEEGARWRD